tara:strand:+ start:2619 stop:2945 length:327 start_codon:yes stop_codon:yes gene_type:complete
MKRLLLPLFASLVLPISVNAEQKPDLTRNDVSDISANAMLTGAVLTTCYGVNNKYLTLPQKQDMIAFALKIHDGIHNTPSRKEKEQLDVMSRVMNRFSNCFPEYKPNP